MTYIRLKHKTANQLLKYKACYKKTTMYIQLCFNSKIKLYSTSRKIELKSWDAKTEQAWKYVFLGEGACFPTTSHETR